jgi:demethylmenaquinone methyltransferase/2-methoxy-6-polyprenyl-1,4-benzoquinol methylase
MSGSLPDNHFKRSRQTARTTYNRYGLFYDVIGGQFERPYAMKGLILLDVQPGESVLEVGFGTGHVILKIAKIVGKNGRVSGIDISDRMCAITRRRIHKAKLTDRVSLHCGDALSMPFETATMDALFMSFTLELFETEDIPLLLKECYRMLKPQGRIGVVSLQRSNRYSRIERLYEWVHMRFPQWVDCRPIRASHKLTQAGFRLQQAEVQPMFGLQVSMIVAIKR